MADVVRSAVDSRRFGKAVARALVESFADVDDVWSRASADKLDLVIVRCDAARMELAQALEHKGALLTDVLVHYRGPTSGFVRAPSDVVIRAATAADRTALGDVARASFAAFTGHYHADPRLDAAASTAAYVEWAQSGLEAEHTEILLATVDDAVAAFLMLRRAPERGEIVLNGVHPSFQRRGLYLALVHEAGNRLREAGIPLVSSSTQIHNIAPQRVWASVGMAAESAQLTFHAWLT